MDIKNTCTLIDKITYFILMRNDRVKYLYYLSSKIKRQYYQNYTRLKAITFKI